MAKIFSLLFIYFFSYTLVFPGRLSVTLSETRPNVNQHFHIKFKVETEDNGIKKISFASPGLTIVTKNDQGVEIQTYNVNGVSRTIRNIFYEYEVYAPKVGSYEIKNISVETQNESLVSNDISFEVIEYKKLDQPFFLESEVSNLNPYQYEKIRVDYYLYTRVNLVDQEIVEYPKLEKFIRRISKDLRQPVRLRREGQEYIRYHLYSADIFSQDVNEKIVDSIRERVIFSKGRRSFFSSFGLSRQNMEKRVLVDEDVILNVQKLPPLSEKVVLVGEHEFSLSINSSKFIVNTPIELKLEVKGPGALELFDAPELPFGDGIELFDVESEVEIMEDFTARKIFRYTFLPRKSTEQKKKKIGFKYFDLEEKKYKEAFVNLPAIEIIGGGKEVSHVESDKKDSYKIKGILENQTKGGSESGIIAPIFLSEGSLSSILTIKNLKKLLFQIFIILVFIQLIFLGKSKLQRSERHLYLFRKMKKEGIRYPLLYEYFELLGTIVNGEKCLDYKKTINNLNLTTDATNYFLNTFLELEEENFGKKDNSQILKQAPIWPIAKYFKELDKKFKNENGS